MIKYLIEIVPLMGGEHYTVEIETENLDWSMEQFKRNREPLSWRIVKEI